MKTFFVPFEGQDFPIVQTEDGRFYVPMKPICDAIGARWATQERKMWRGDAYKSTRMHVRALDARDEILVIPAIRLFGWLRSFHNGLAKDPISQENCARFQDAFVDAVEVLVIAGAPAIAEAPDAIDDKEWRFGAIEARLDKIERRLTRGGGEN